MVQSLADSLIQVPIPYDSDHAATVVSALPEPLRAGAMGELVCGVAGSSPFLSRMLELHGNWLSEVVDEPAGEVVGRLVSAAREESLDADRRGLLSALRRARCRAALFIALADLSGAWEFEQVVRAITDLADNLTDTALRWLVASEIARGKIPGMTEDDIPTGAGICVLAMGKMGARELNYSSDIDLICLFDQDRVAPEDYPEARSRYIRIVRQLVTVLSERTADGQVFRTDLRLRPSPSTTQLCMSMDSAERYYETIGRTWERAAHIKARPVAGDIAAGIAYLRRISPFVWRRSLDYAAVQDIESVLRKIREKKGRFSPAAVPGCDIKLHPGGIREIEFFAQTRQLIAGGRLPVLRDPTTLGALAALRDEEIIDAKMCATLSEAYVSHRIVEHRLQMVEDNQTQTVPVDPEARARVAALDGWTDHKVWEDSIAIRLSSVHKVVEEFFDASGGRPVGTAETQIDEQSLASYGFAQPAEVYRTLQRWRSGGITATGSERARQLYASLEADLVELVGRADSPDSAIAELDRFLSGLPSGVQVFSLFNANRHLLELIIDIFASAPRLAEHLGRRPHTLDTLLADDFFERLPPQDWLEADLHIEIGDTTDYERVLDTCRRWAREFRFRVGVQVLLEMADEIEAGEALSAIAETVLCALVPFVVENFSERHGPPPGRGMAVIAMGKLGTREMTVRSDLDLITVYDAAGVEQSEGRRPLSSPAYYVRLTQALISALTARTAEGRLYAVDMRLRPSGNQGPTAVSLSTFLNYQTRQAWVWEHMALTRSRIVSGDESLVADTARVIRTALAERKGDDRVLKEAREMRGRLINAHSDERENPWALKHTAGGLMEIEFLAQTGGLYHGIALGRSAREILGTLGEIGWITPEEARELIAALSMQARLNQIDCVALEQPFDPAIAGKRLMRVMAEAVECADFGSLEKALPKAQKAAAAACARVLDGD